MLKNHNHDLVHALSEKNDAVWRYENEYLKNAAGCQRCSEMWRQMQNDDNKHIEMLTSEIRHHIEEKRFD
jgi:hypothetical protein